MMTQATGRVGNDLCNLSTLLGRYFQIRDDYQNLVSTDVSVSTAIAIESENKVINTKHHLTVH